MSRIARFAVLVTALASLMGVVSATAGAVTWHNTGNTAYTATGGPVTMSVGANNLACTASSATGSAPGGSVVGSTYVMGGTITLSPCTLAGQSTYVHCGVTDTLVTYSGGVSSGNEDWTCTVRLAATNTALCHIEGQWPDHYINPVSPARGRWTVTHATLTITHSSGTSCLLIPSGATSAPLTMRHFTITITNASGGTGTLGPVINRTA
jgi:hypothetical protein